MIPDTVETKIRSKREKLTAADTLYTVRLGRSFRAATTAMLKFCCMGTLDGLGFPIHQLFQPHKSRCRPSYDNEINMLQQG